MRTKRVDAAIGLLAFGSGSINALSFTGLGGVFTSVMTGNLVLLGVAVVRLKGTVALHSLAAIAAYIAGVFGTARWLAVPRLALAAVALLQAAGLVAWAVVSGHPSVPLEIVLVAVAALAMGMQSAAVNALPGARASTTYLTSTLTALTAEVATAGAPGWRRFAVLAAALCGAVLATVMFVWVRPAAPALPLAATTAAVLVSGPTSSRRAR
jgi:uncharacterized membrane protein YoaK (UPF0700 family)